MISRGGVITAFVFATIASLAIFPKDRVRAGTDDEILMVTEFRLTSIEPARQSIQVPKWSPITTFSATATKAFRLSQNVLVQKGKRIVPAGSKLLGSVGPDNISCLQMNVDIAKEGFPEVIDGLKRQRIGCFADFDHDGRFERFARNRTNFLGFRRREFRPIEPVAYEAIDPATIRGLGEFGVYFLNDTNQNTVVFSACALAEKFDSSGCLSSGTAIKKDAFPATFTMLGVTYRVDGYAKQFADVSQLDESRDYQLMIRSRSY